MKKNNVIGYGSYVAPACDISEIVPEGVLCMSFGTTEGISDEEGDGLEAW